MENRIRRSLTAIGVFTASPWAVALLGIYIAAWLVFDRDSFDWHAVATLATWFMALFIQRAEHRDTQAIQAKLDELIRAQSGARNELTHIDEKEPEEIEAQREGKK